MEERVPIWPAVVDVDDHGLAVIDDTGALTWAELDHRIRSLCAVLTSCGLPDGAPVVVLSTNRREIVELWAACLRGGWEYVPVNWHFTAEQVSQVITDLAPGMVVVDPTLVALVVAAREHCGAEAMVGGLILDDGGGGDERPDGFGSYEGALAGANLSPDADPPNAPGSTVFFTSGTTGRARGVRVIAGEPEAAEMLDRALDTVQAAGLPEHGRSLMCGPHYHWAQWTFAVVPMLLGSTLVIQHRFVPANTLRAIDHHQITNVLMVPTQFLRLLRLDDPTRRSFSGESLARVIHGAAPCAPETKRAMIEWWGPIFTEYYGATEGGVVSLIDSEEWLQHPGSVGQPLPWNEVEIVADDGSMAEPGVDGVLHVRHLDGADMEFVGSPEVTAAVHARPGHVTFSDIGRMDRDGYLYLSDRSTDMIVSGGINVSSTQVEGVLQGHPAVADVAVFGVPHVRSGQTIVAALQLVPGQAWDESLCAELAARCQDQLAPHQCPAHYEMAEELPRTTSGKLIKRRLRARHWGYPID